MSIPKQDLPEKKRILITGSNGLLGQKLIELLVTKQDITVIATASGKNRLPFSNGYLYQEMDVTNKQMVDEVIMAIQPDVVIHTAAMTNVDQCEMGKRCLLESQRNCC